MALQQSSINKYSQSGGWPQLGYRFSPRRMIQIAWDEIIAPAVPLNSQYLIAAQRSVARKRQQPALLGFILLSPFDSS